MRGSRIASAAVGLAFFAPASAAAQDDGVFVDPDSPTAKQYAIPLESARRQADPSSDGRLAAPGGRPAGTGAAALFGEGIVTASRPGRRSSKAASEPDSTRGSNAKSHSSDPGSSASSEAVHAAVSNPGAPSGGVGSTLLIAGGAALVLLLGGLTGLALRRRSAD